MKKLFIRAFEAIALLVLVVTLLGCKQSQEKIKILLPSGTPLMAVAGLLDNEYYEFEVASGADVLAPAMVSKSHDVVIAPINAGAKAYIGGGSKFKMASVITLGNNYIISKKDVKLDSLKDLEGKKVMAYGQNNVPDMIMKAALAKEGVNAVVEYVASVADTAAYLANVNDEYDFILTAEPQLSTLQIKKGFELNIIDLQAVLKDEIAKVPQAAVYVNPEANQASIKAFLKDLEKNIESLNEKPEEYANNVVAKHAFFETLGKEVLAKCLPTSNITFMSAKDNIEILEAYYALVDKYNPKFFNGARPDEAFYY